MILLWIIIPLFILYSILIIFYWRAWINIPDYDASNFTSGIFISVIIPARNEEKNIGTLLEALGRQEYPAHLIEVIVIDDDSEDKTADIIRSYPAVRLLFLKETALNSHKKKALEIGIAAARGELIVTTDADCRPSPRWLKTLASFAGEHHSVFIAAPVSINCDDSIVQTFQAIDFMVLQGITAAVVHKKWMTMCNGANLAYQKSIFNEVNGFEGIGQIASGDDMLLMHKIWKKHPAGVHYLKSKQAIVETAPVKNWKEFFQQRIRWASKARHYDDKRIFPVLLLVYLFNLSFIVLMIGGFFDQRYWIILLALWFMKTIVELPFFISLAIFFDKRWAINRFFFFQPLHIIYTIISGLFGQFGKYKWKGRWVK